jgi:hypothetical protein
MPARIASKPPASVQQQALNLEDQIRSRAYELYEQRGREDGRDLEDWFRAEEEIKQKQGRRVAA